MRVHHRVTLALVAALLLAPPAWPAAIGIDVAGFSHHFDRQASDGTQFSEFNPGGGLNWVILRTSRQTVVADAGIFRDSFREANRYADLAWTHRLVGHLQGGVALVASSTRTINDGEPFMGPVPMLSWRADRAAVQLAYLIKGSGINEYPSLAVFGTVYPFGANRVSKPDTSRHAANSGRRTGLEFTAGPDFRLAGLEDAALAIRRRNGHRGWRLTVDLGALVSHHAQHLDSQRFDVEGRAQRLFQGQGRRGLSLLTGIGPILGYTNDDPGSGMRRWRLGATGSCGVEWQAVDSFSLLAECGLDLIYISGRREDYPDGLSIEQRLTSISLEPRPVRLGLTAWFH